MLVGNADAQIIPVFHVQFKDRAPALIATPWNGDDEKRLAVAAMRAGIQQFRDKIVNYCFISEAWVATEDRRHPSGLQPRDREDKYEVVMINARSKEAGRFVILRIERDDKGRVSKLVKEDVSDIVSRSGQLDNLFED